MIDTEKMGKLIQLPLEVMLKNNVAISYFIDYMSAIGGGCQAYIFFYLNVEGWKVMAEQQIQAMELDTILRESGQEIEPGKEMSPEHKRNLQDQMRDAAQSIYEEYLSEKASPQLKIDETAIKRLVFKIRSENPQSEWFDEVQARVYDKLSKEEKFLDSFRQSYGYIKLLKELSCEEHDFLKPMEDEATGSDQAGGGSSSGGGCDDQSIYDSLSLNSYDSSTGPSHPVENGDPASIYSPKNRRSHRGHRRTSSSVSDISLPSQQPPGGHRRTDSNVSSGHRRTDSNASDNIASNVGHQQVWPLKQSCPPPILG